MFKFDKNSSINQGRYRLREPKEFKRFWIRKDSIFRGISYVQGILKNGDFSIQSIRFDRNIWTEKKAANWWKKYKKKFEKYLKIRRNPTTNRNKMLDLFIETYQYGEPWDFAKLITYLKQGYVCDDCGTVYDWCQCEKCDDCNYSRCLCDLDLGNAYDERDKPTIKTKNIVKKETLKLAEKYLSSEDLKYFKGQFKSLN